MSKYKVFITKDVLKFLKSVDKNITERILNKIKQLENFREYHLDIVPIYGEENTYRLRIGKYRVLFYVNEDKKEIIVFKIDVRGRIYKNYKV